jgi:hypothetical protein
MKFRYDYVLDSPEDWHIYEVREDSYEWDTAYKTFAAAKRALMADVKERASSWTHLKKVVAKARDCEAFQARHKP